MRPDSAISSFSESEVAAYRAIGFIRSCSQVFSDDRFKELEKLTALIHNRNPAPGNSVYVPNLLYKVPSFLDFIIEKNILDMVESLIGPDFGLLPSSAFVKLPSSESFEQFEPKDELSKIGSLAMLLAMTPSTSEFDVPKGFCIFYDTNVVQDWQPNLTGFDRIFLSFRFFSTDTGPIGQPKGRIHLRGADVSNNCEYSIVGAGKF